MIIWSFTTTLGLLKSLLKPIECLVWLKDYVNILLHLWYQSYLLHKCVQHYNMVMPFGNLTLFLIRERLKRFSIKPLDYYCHSKINPIPKFVHFLNNSNQLKLFKYCLRLLCWSNYFFNRIIKYWNQLPAEIVNCRSLNNFKSLLDRHFIYRCKIYFCWAVNMYVTMYALIGYTAAGHAFT